MKILDYLLHLFFLEVYTTKNGFKTDINYKTFINYV